jgi:membrane-bound serine protease (ClpP class)
MKSYFTIFLPTFLLMFSFSSVFAQENIKENEAQNNKILVIEIRDEINPPMARYVKLAFEEADRIKPKCIVVDMDTYGGIVSDADEIRNLFLKSKYPAYVFINQNAASAGALIAIACDSIYMAPGSSIGAATVVSGADGSKMPDKYQSYMRGKMRATAEARGRNPEIAEAMVDERVSIPGIIDSTRILTFSVSEAIKHRYCEAEVTEIAQILARNKVENYQIVRFEVSFVEQIIAWVLNPFVSSLLILVIIGGIYYELQTPGVGFPLAAAITALLLYLIPYYLNGLAANWEIIAFFIGVLLIMIEIFAIPGFGVVGFSGIFLVFSSLLLMMLKNDFFDFSGVENQQLSSAVAVTLSSIFGTMLVVFFGASQILNSRFFKRVALQGELTADSGFTTITVHQDLIGQYGEAYSVLRPAGKIMVGGTIYDATTRGEFINKDEKVQITALNGNTFVVKKVL